MLATTALSRYQVLNLPVANDSNSNPAEPDAAPIMMDPENATKCFATPSSDTLSWT